MDGVEDEASGSGFGSKFAAATGVGAIIYGVWQGTALVLDNVGEMSCERSASTVEELKERQYDQMIRAMQMRGWSEAVTRKILKLPSSVEVADPQETARDESGTLTCTAVLRSYDAIENKVTDSQIKLHRGPASRRRVGLPCQDSVRAKKGNKNG